MLTYVLRRVVWGAVVILIVSAIVFFGVTAVTGDPLGELRHQPGISQETLDEIAARKHLNEPIYIQYAYWVRDAVTNGFGTTLVGDRVIWPDLRRSMWFTIQMVLLAEAFAIVVAIGVGVLSARRQYSWFDNAATTASFIGFAIPVFWAALMLQVLATVFFERTGIRLVYTAGLSSADATMPFLIDRAQHLALPIAALAITSVAQYSRYMRVSMLEVVNSEYVRTAVAKGVPQRKVTTKHALRNALIPLTTVIGWNLGVVFGGTIVIETIFAIPGMGRYFFDALMDRDIYPLMAWLIVTGIAIVVANLITDVIYGYLDPRIRLD